MTILLCPDAIMPLMARVFEEKNCIYDVSKDQGFIGIMLYLRCQ